MKPYNYDYIVGQKSTTSSGFPVNVNVKFDPDAKRTFIKIAAIVGLGMASIGVGIAMSKRRPIK